MDSTLSYKIKPYMYRTMKKRAFTSALKTKFVLVALSERFTNQELGQKHFLHPT